MGAIGILVLVAVIGLFLYLIIAGYLSRRAKRLGFSTIKEYLKAVPSNDEEKTDAADLALKGTVVCLFGINFFPLLLIGLIPLYYGGRKILLTLMGMGLFNYQEN